MTIDHIVPRSQGGEHKWSNLVAACPSCNHRKGGRTIDQGTYASPAETCRTTIFGSLYLRQTFNPKQGLGALSLKAGKSGFQQEYTWANPSCSPPDLEFEFHKIFS